MTPVTLVDGVDVDAVHDAVVACPGVAALGSGLPAGATTYLPGRRIPGLRVLDDVVEIEIRMYLGSTQGPGTDEVGARVRQAAAPHVAGKRIDVIIADVVLPGESLIDEPPAPPAPSATATSVASNEGDVS